MNYVIIGGSAAGVMACEAIRKRDEKAKITLVSDEKLPLYSRCLLTYLLAGQITEDKLTFRDPDFYKKNKIDAILGVRAKSIDVKKRAVKLSNGKSILYDKLLLATGANPKSIDIPGVDKEGFFTIRRIDDARGMIKLMDKVKRVVVLGGGLIGLRDAYALMHQGKKVSVIAKSSQVLSQMLDKEAADIIRDTLVANGIEVKTQAAAKEITGGKTVEGVLLDDGTKVDCQMVIVGKGVIADIALAKGSGIKTHWGFLVDEYMATNVKGIFAAGDCAETRDLASGEMTINGLWPCAVEQGGIAGANMTGEKIAYEGSLSMNSVEFFGLPAISMGITKPKTDDYETLVFENRNKNLYRKIVLKDNLICGAVFINGVESAGVINVLMRKRIDISGIKERLVDNNFSFATVMPLIKDNSDSFTAEEFLDTIKTYQ
ncbi:MAG: NAD(P)/FAD-dependent oxidoreductase [Candidatus Omnitrophica bacterium]|nr:NAD(P)/FAD-dependent oxidoreductase [Candidatus Omnitrophota bacterium]